MAIYVVKPRGVVCSVAAMYRVSARGVIQYNELDKPNRLVSGQTTVILFPRRAYIVETGDTVCSTTQQYGITINELYRNNIKLGALPVLRPGEWLVISCEQQRLEDMSVSDYAYPFVDRTLFRQTTPFTTYMTPFTYGPTFSDDLVPPDDEALIDTALQHGVAPLICLSTLAEEGGFSSELAHHVLNNMQVQNRLLDNVLISSRQKNYKGLDVDFEFIYVEGCDKYTASIRSATQKLNPEGYEVTVALAPKTSSDQPGSSYQGHNYRGLGAVANGILLMAYEWGYTYGPPMAVAPVPNIRAVLNYTVTQIARDKTYIGMPNYGYDQPLPYVRGTTGVQSTSNVEAVRLTRKYNTEILYDKMTQSPYFQYTNTSGELHEVWFEDAQGIRVELVLTTEPGFPGIGYWNLVRPFPQNWLVLNTLYYIRALQG